LKNQRHYWVGAENQKEIFGFWQAYLKKKETGIVESIYVNKKHRQKGVGKKILKELIRWLKSKKRKCIERNAFIKNKPSFGLQKNSGLFHVS